MSSDSSDNLVGVFGKQIAFAVVLIVGLFVVWCGATYILTITPYSVYSPRIVSALMQQSLTLGLVSVVILWLWSLIKFLASQANIVGHTTEQRLIGFIIASIFKPVAIWTILTLPVFFVEQAFTYDFDSQREISEYTSESSSSVLRKNDITAETLAPRISDSIESWIPISAVSQFKDVLLNVIWALRKVLYDFRYDDIAVFLLTWIIVARVIPSNDPGIIGEQSDSPAKQANQVVILMFVGIYLAIIAMISLPWFDGEPVTDATKYETFERDIQNVQGVPKQSVEKPEDKPDAEIGPDLSKLIEKVRELPEKHKVSFDELPKVNGAEKLAQLVAEAWNQRLEMFKATFNEILTNQEIIKEEVVRSRKDLATQIEEIKNKILSHYRINIQQVRRERDRVRFYQQSLGWYEESVSNLHSDMRRCENLPVAIANALSTSIFLMDTRISADRRTLLDSYLNFLVSKTQRDDRQNTVGNNLTYSASDNDTRLHASLIMGEFKNALPSLESFPNFAKMSFCEINFKDQSLPQPVKPGESWGVFGHMSAWLLEAETIEMCLLTGMLGFGLLGATLSYVFFSVDSSQDASKRGFSMAIIVVLRGATAAVATYLLLRGGVNLITDAGGSVSPYILFATCFVAAIYSEQTWKRIHSWFGKGEDAEDN